MEQQTYQVRLPAFEGPLDLLLHLIEQQELDITTIALAQVTDQYLSYLQALQEIVPDDLTAFLTVAARLLLIKSRVLLPRPSQDVEEEEDVGEDLVRQLREYKRFKQIAQILHRRDQDALHMYTRALPPSRQAEGWQPKLDLSGTALDDLTAVLHTLLREQVALDAELGVTLDAVTIDQKIAQISASLRARQVLTFDSLLNDLNSKVEIIVTLLALLEMIRDLRVSAQQEGLFGVILIQPGEKYQPYPAGETQSGQTATTWSG